LELAQPKPIANCVSHKNEQDINEIKDQLKITKQFLNLNRMEMWTKRSENLFTSNLKLRTS